MRFLTLLIIVLLSTSTSCPAQGIVPKRFFDYSITIRHSADAPAAVILPIDNALPAYPGEMLRANLNGQATAKLLIREDGTVSDIRVDATAKELAESTQRAVALWRFHPPRDRKTQEPIPVSLTCVVTFAVVDE